MAIANRVRRALLFAALALILCDLGVWVYFYFRPPAPPWFGTAVGLAAAAAVALATLGGLPDLVGAPPDEPWEDQDEL